MPVTTALSPVPEARPGVEAQFGYVPGYYLSEVVQDSRSGSPIQQALLAFEPGRLVGVPGLGVGARYVGKGEVGGYLEPLLRYRLGLDAGGHSALGVVLHGTHASGDAEGASYSATRAGGEVAFDVRVTPESRWTELHLLWSLGAMALVADGDYCTDEEGRFGVDCPDDGLPVTRQAGEVSGFYPVLGATIAGDFARHRKAIVHGLRLGLHGAIGTMPRMEYGEQGDAEAFAAFGASVTLGLGAKE